MINDRQASELVSKSLRQPLSAEEAEQMQEHLDRNEQTHVFAKISQVIQDSISDVGLMAESGDETVGPKLPVDARKRLKDSVLSAIEQETATHETGTHEAQTQETSVQETSTEKTARQQTSGSDFDVIMTPSSRESRSGRDAKETRQVVSRYTLIRKLGEGGLGVVWLARDEKLKRNVAIKEIDSTAAESPRAWQRFHREAEITGHLEHPNVVPLYEFGTDPKRGQPFYVMRFVGKRTLADAIIEHHDRQQSGEADPLELHRLLTAFLDVCQAIAYAHSRGVVHRDLKPENIALDNFGQVIVLDWGLAKLTDDGELNTRLTIGQVADDNSLMRTLAGEVVGTPLYMAPEQAAGDLDNVDELTDVYGLGAILFAILTGCAPHEKSHPPRSEQQVNVRQVLKAIADGDTPQVHDYNTDVPADLAAICKKAMARKRYARHQSALEVANDVERWTAGQSRKHQQYENLRIEGRELCANMQSCLRDLGTNARFMSNLPPIQGIIDAHAGRIDDDENVWRERLSTIFRGLLQANVNYASVMYCGVEEHGYREIVRVERSSSDGANIRNVPRSRLANGDIDDTIRRIMQQKPGDIDYSPTSPSPDTASAVTACTGFRVSAAVPLYDEQSEEPFGWVAIECDLDRILERDLRHRIRYASEVLVVGCQQIVLLHDNRRHGRVSESFGKTLSDVVPDAQCVLDTLEDKSEFLDETNRELYATRLALGPNAAPLTFLLVQRPTRDD